MSGSIVCCSASDVETWIFGFVENTIGNTGVLLVRWLHLVSDQDVYLLFTDFYRGSVLW
jgi:hypothetical protein